MTRKIVVAALYKFVSLPDYVALREPLLETLTHNGIKGTLLLAEEGINGTVSGTARPSMRCLNGFGSMTALPTSTTRNRTATSSRSIAPRSS